MVKTDIFSKISTLDNLIEVLCSVHSRFTKYGIRPQGHGPQIRIEDDEYELREWILQDISNKLPSLINSMEDLQKIVNLGINDGLGDRLVGPQLQKLHNALEHKFIEILKNSNKKYSMKDIEKLFFSVYFWRSLDRNRFQPGLVETDEEEKIDFEETERTSNDHVNSRYSFFTEDNLEDEKDDEKLDNDDMNQTPS